MIEIKKDRLNSIISKFEEWLNIYVASNNNECDHTFTQFKKFCRLKQHPFKSCVRELKKYNINCDCEIILKMDIIDRELIEENITAVMEEIKELKVEDLEK